MSNRFQVFANEVDDEVECETSNLISGDDQIPLDVCEDLNLKETEVPVYCTEVSGMNRESLILSSIRSAKENPDTANIGIAMEFLWNMMKDYGKIVSLNLIAPARNCDFISQVNPKSKRFFTEIAKSCDGSWQGNILSMWSWYRGKDANGRSIYTYICTYEGYGSCSYCDSLESNKSDLFWMRVSLEEMRCSLNGNKKDLDVDGDTQIVDPLSEEEKQKLRIDISSKVDEIREMITNNVCDNFKSLHFFETFGEAKKFIIDRAEERVEFKKPEKIPPHKKQFFIRYKDFPTLV